jgi:hypothetical protein
MMDLPVHWEVMVDPVQQEVQDQCPIGIRQDVINVEQEPVESVFEERPDDVSCEEARDKFGERGGGEG